MIYQWWLLRTPVLLFLPSFLYDIEIMFLISPFLILHFTFGLKTIASDYLQNQTLKIFLLTLIRLLNLEFLRYTLEFFI